MTGGWWRQHAAHTLRTAESRHERHRQQMDSVVTALLSDLDRITKMHQPDTRHRCRECALAWPCATVQLSARDLGGHR